MGTGLVADLTQLSGAGLVVTEIGVDPPPLAHTPGVVQVGVHRGGPAPGGGLDPLALLAFALEHPDAPPVRLSGAGPAFSAGGDLDEFGRAPDPGQAHLVRILRSSARLAQALGDRLTVEVHGACIGAGIEVPAAAARIAARPGAPFRLPAGAMGLIPGAGGTATIPRRIGRRRACWMAISGAEVDLATALAWGLVDEVAV